VIDLLVVPLLVVGTLFVLLAGVGVFRMPDLFSRMQASTKAGTLGVGCLILAVGLHFGDLGVATRALLVVAFLFLTAPVAAHMIAQAAYFTDVPRWEGSVIDEFRDMHEQRPPTAVSHGGSPDAAPTEATETRRRASEF
jgi:multicomponent Na+:H+ antiporter subunit G